MGSGGLFPLDVRTGQSRSPVRVPGLTSAAATSGGTRAVGVVLPSDASPDVNPAVVTVDLPAGTVGRRIPIHPTPVQYADRTSSVPSYALTGVAVTPDGTTALVGDEAAGDLLSVNLGTGRVSQVALPHEPALNSLVLGLPAPTTTPALAPMGQLAVAPNGRTAYLVDGYDVLVIDLALNRVDGAVTGFEGPSGIAIAPDGRTAYVTNPWCWQSLTTTACGPKPAHPVVEPNGTIQFCGCGQHVSVVDLATRRITREIDLGLTSQPTGVAVSPDGSTVYVTDGQWSSHMGQVAVIDARAGTVTGTIPFRLPSGPEGADDIAVTAGGSTAYVDSFVTSAGGPPVYPGVVPIDLRTRTARPAISVSPETAGVLFGP